VTPGRPRHVGLNLVFLVPGETGGMEVYARELVPALREAAPDMRLTVFTNREAADERWADGVERVVVPVDARNRVHWVRGEQQLLPGLAARAGCDLVHSLASTAPLRGPFRRLTTVHDLIYRVFPEAHFGVRALGMQVLVPAAALRSHRLVADSASTRDDLHRLYRVPTRKVDVVPLGVRVREDAPALGADEVRRRHAIAPDRPIALSVSAKRPHKNLARLLEALALLEPERRPVLVIPGYPTPHEAELRAQAAALGVAQDVRFPAWVDRDELEGLYRAAAVVVVPSLYEGFGLPVLEAMARGVPVASSDRSSLPEVAGDAALLFDPEDPAAIARAVGRIVEDPSVAEDLRERGRARAREFTWRRTAEATLAAYERALDR